MRYSSVRMTIVIGEKAHIFTETVDIDEEDYNNSRYYKWKNAKDKLGVYKYFIVRDVEETESGDELYEVHVAFTENHPLFNINITDNVFYGGATYRAIDVSKKLDKLRDVIVYNLVKTKLPKK
jgi:hypothetical protein